jgi:hypothetical protein
MNMKKRNACIFQCRSVCVCVCLLKTHRKQECECVSLFFYV